MSKRNLILFIIVLTIIIAIVFGFFYFYRPANQTGSVTEGTNFLANFLPFGNDTKTTPSGTTPPADISGFKPTNETNTTTLKLKKISTFPIAGFGVFMKERFKNVSTTQEQSSSKTTKSTPSPTELMPALRYVNKATGNIYQTFADRIDQRKFSLTVVPRIHEAYFGNKGGSVVMRYLKEDTKTIEDRKSVV